MRPRILVTLDTSSVSRKGVPFETVELKSDYALAVEKAGGLPWLAAPTTKPEIIAALAQQMHGLVLTGGDFDLSPELYGQTQEVDTRVDAPKPQRTHFESALLNAALAANKPVLGICAGMQLMNVLLGGTLIHDISANSKDALEHEQATSPREGAHRVLLSEAAERWRKNLGRSEFKVNTTHHQAVDRVAPTLEVWATSTDGIIEAIAHKEKPLVGVQWHPELLGDDVSDELYGWLVEKACSAG